MFIIQRFLARKKLRRRMTIGSERLSDSEDEIEWTEKEPKVRERSITHTRIIGINPELPLLLSSLSESEHKALVCSWRFLTKQHRLKPIERIMVLVFEKFLSKRRKARMLFVQSALAHDSQVDRISTMHDHARKMAAILEAIVKPNRAKLEVLGPSLIASKHMHLCPNGFTADYWEIFGRCLAAVLTDEEAIRALPHACRAWNLLAAAFTDRIRAGYERDAKRKTAKTNIKKLLIDNKIKCQSAPVRRKFGHQHISKLISFDTETTDSETETGTESNELQRKVLENVQRKKAVSFDIGAPARSDKKNLRKYSSLDVPVAAEQRTNAGSQPSAGNTIFEIPEHSAKNTPREEQIFEMPETTQTEEQENAIIDDEILDELAPKLPEISEPDLDSLYERPEHDVSYGLVLTPVSDQNMNFPALMEIKQRCRSMNDVSCLLYSPSPSPNQKTTQFWH